MRWFALFGLLVLAWLAGGWILMLLIGAFHHEWWPLIPTISYSGALHIELVIILGLLLGGAIKALVEAVDGWTSR